MNPSDKGWKDLRKMLNAAWDASLWWSIYNSTTSDQKNRKRRYRDVSKILKAAKKKEGKDG